MNRISYVEPFHTYTIDSGILVLCLGVLFLYKFLTNTFVVATNLGATRKRTIKLKTCRNSIEGVLSSEVEIVITTRVYVNG